MIGKIHKRWAIDQELEMFTVTPCVKCKHYLADDKCAAFPEGIPEVIINLENDHSMPLPNQVNNIVFEEEVKLL